MNGFMYVLDAALIIMLGVLAYNSQKVELETGINMKWAMPVMFLLVAALSFWRYEGTMKWVQTVFLILAAGLCYTLKTGLAKEGVVSFGSMLRYEKMRRISLSKRDSCLWIETKYRKASVSFKPEQMPQVRAYLKDKVKLTGSGK